jgi:hypothetical protein
MKTLKILFLILGTLVFNVAMAVGIAPALELTPVAIFKGLLGIEAVVSFLPMPKGVLGMAIQKEIWIGDIVANLFKANPHLNYAMNADQFVLAGKVVHIPNAGNKPGVKRNRTNLPASVTIREDVDITFSLDEYTTDPILITNAEQYETSYDKRLSVTSEQSNALAELVGDWFFYYWAPSAATNIIRTTGSSVTAHVGTGSRKKLTVADVKKAQLTMNKQLIGSQDRYAQLDADMYDQLLDDMTATQYRDFSAQLNPAEGTVGKLYGFTFLPPRPSVLSYTNDTTPAVKAPDAASAATDNAAGLFWQKDMVIRALGTQEFYENEGDATYFGDIYSALLRAGGRKKRNDGKGVIALVQASV